MIITALTIFLVALMIKVFRLDTKFSITKTELKERYYIKLVIIIGLLLFELIYLEQTVTVFIYGFQAFYWIVSANRDRKMILWFEKNNNKKK